jgi:aminoglycoside 3-N-acetyltransferase
MSILDRLARALPPALKNRLKKSRNKLLFYYRERLPAVEKSALRQALYKLGIRPGDVVFVHSSLDQMRAIRATPVQIIEILCEAVGTSGTIVMPTFPMTGTSQAYLEQHPVFDWRRTPSRAGLLTEIFRRMPGTERSLHPTHSVAARGAAAKWLTEGHERCEGPFDERSPFQKLFQMDALILSIGQFSAMTFRHLADHLLQNKIPYAIYSDQPTNVRVIGKGGEAYDIFTKVHNPDLDCNHQIVLTRMAQEGTLKTAKVSRIPLAIVPVQTYVQAYQRYYALGLFHHYLKSRQATLTLKD